MKITAIEATNLVIPYEPGYRPAWQPGIVRHDRDFTLVKVTVDEGLVGYGGSDGHHAATIHKSVTPYLVGQPVWATERHQEVLRNAGGMFLVDQALWDIQGKAAGLPLYRLWGAYRDSVPAYASAAELGTVEDRVRLALRYRAEGFTALKLRLHRARLEEDLELVDAVRAAVPAMVLMVDANQATNLPRLGPAPVWDYARALRTARALEQRGVLWLEEPLPRYDFEDLIRLREHTEIYIAGGESNRNLHEFRWLIERGVYDIIQADCGLSEGISQLRKIAALAEIFHRHFVPHHGLSGLGLAAALHLVCTVPGMAWLELMYEPPTRSLETYQRLGGILTSTIFVDPDGLVRPPDRPGLGVDVNEEVIARYAVPA